MSWLSAIAGMHRIYGNKLALIQKRKHLIAFGKLLKGTISASAGIVASQSHGKQHFCENALQTVETLVRSILTKLEKMEYNSKFNLYGTISVKMRGMLL